MAFSYEAWVTAQAAEIEQGVRRAGAWSHLAVYVMPSEGAAPGRLVLAEEKPHGAVSVLRFPAQGSRITAVPYSHMRSLIWAACRHEPICPTA